MDSKSSFSLKRLIDGLEYRFTLRSGRGKASVFSRDDNVVEIVYNQKYGWSTWQESDGSGQPTLTGRVWEVLPQDQGDFPTEGIWVSRKGPKSYVYALEYQQ